jgi:hypothetical protein
MGYISTLTIGNASDTKKTILDDETYDRNITANNVTITSKGTLTSSSSGTFNVSGNWTNNGGTFTPGTGTVTFNGTGAQAINGTAASQTFYNLTTTMTAGQILSVSGSTATLTTQNLTETTGNFTAPATLNINGNLTITAGTFTAGANINASGSWTNNAGAGGFTSGTTMTFNATTGTPTFTSGGATMPNIVVNNSGVTTFTLADALTCGTLTITAGRLDSSTRAVTNTGFTLTNGTLTGSGAWAINGNLIYTSGTNSHTGIWTQSGTANLSWNTGTQLIISYVAASGAAITLTNTTYVQKANVPADAAVSVGNKTFTIYGPLATAGISLLGTWTSTSPGSVTISAFRAAISNSGSISIGTVPLIITNSNGGVWTQSGAISCGTFNLYAGSGVTTLTMSNNLSAGAITLGTTAASNYSGVLNLGSGTHAIASIVRGNAANLADAINLGGSNTSVSGNLNFTGIAATQGTSTVTLTGSSQTIGGTANFYNLTAITPDQVIIFPQTATTTISGTLKLEGGSGHNILLKSDQTGTDGSKAGRARVDIAAVSDNHSNAYVQYVTPYDNDASHGAAQPIQQQNSVDGGNNLGWGFGTVSCSVDQSSTSFGILDSGTVNTASVVASTTMTCSYAGGCTMFVQDNGNSTTTPGSPGLYAASATGTPLILSSTGTLSAGTEGYGIQAATTSAGSGATLILSTTYFKSGNDIGGLTTSAIAIASSTSAVTGREVVVTHKAAISGATPQGSYSDTITYSCVGN